jgi:DNA-binding NarL/FixJ family response regulator
VTGVLGEPLPSVAQAKRGDVVITDLGMPNMGGEELFDKLQSMNSKVKVSTILKINSLIQNILRYW